MFFYFRFVYCLTCTKLNCKKMRQRRNVTKDSTGGTADQFGRKREALDELVEDGVVSVLAKLVGRVARASGVLLFPIYFTRWFASERAANTFAEHESLLLAPLFLTTVAGNAAKAFVTDVRDIKKLN